MRISSISILMILLLKEGRSHSSESSSKTNSSVAKKTALFIVDTDTEELELVAPVDILRRAKVDVKIAHIADADYNLDIGPQFLRTKNYIFIRADVKLIAVKNITFDAVVIPGGPSYKALAESKVVGKILREHEKSGKVVAAICAAPLVLYKHGIAKGKRLTSYPTVKKDIEGFYTYKEDTTVVDGNLVTSRGPATAVEFGLALLEVLLGHEAKVKVAKDILYPL